MSLGKYFVKRDEDEDIAPEETLIDSLSAHSHVEVPVSRNVFRLFFTAVILILVIFSVQAFRLQVLRGDAFALIAEQSRLAKYPVPALRGIIYDRNNIPLVQNVPVFDLVAVRSELASAKNPEYEHLLVENKNEAVFVIEKDISKNEAIKWQTLSPAGIYVVSYARREYIGGSAFAHILGYTSQISPDELKADRGRLYGHNDRVGRLGLEATYESRLHGDLQEILLGVDESTKVSISNPGDDVYTNIDKELQEQLYRALNSVFRASGVTKGAAIVQDVKNGAVLGMISMPTFDPNIFENSNTESATIEINRILRSSNKPLFNRVVSGLYASGSTIKPLYALAALKEKIISPNKIILADGAIYVQSQVDPDVVFTFKDWKVHGWSDMRKAIADSVDVYFYAIGGGYGDQIGLGVDRLEKYLKQFRADQKTGVDLPLEVNGLVPSKAWKKETKGESWYVGDTYNLSIGQGDLLVTPLWINMYTSAIANGGKLMQPQIAKNDPKELSRVDFDSETWRIVREGMRQTITDGTGELLNDLPRAVAAKTGTAQIGTGKELNSLFTAYGPYESPEISITVLVENIPESQSLAMKVAKEFLSWYFISHP